MSNAAPARLSAGEREAAIIAEVHTTGFASVAALSAELAVSEMTIRRDLRRLAADGELRVVHGGVSLSHGTLKTATFAGRAEQHSEAKQRIARAALRLVPPGGTVAFDSGTTCFAVAAGLDRDFRGCVVTHSVPVLQQMLACPQATVIGLGGELLAESQVLIGPSTTAAAAGLSVDLFFLGANSVDARGVYLRGNREKAVKSALMAAARQVALLVDGSKLTHTAPVRLAELGAVSIVITDGPVPAAVRAAAKRADVQIVRAD